MSLSFVCAVINVTPARATWIFKFSTKLLNKTMWNNSTENIDVGRNFFLFLHFLCYFNNKISKNKIIIIITHLQGLVVCFLSFEHISFCYFIWKYAKTYELRQGNFFVYEFTHKKCKNTLITYIHEWMNDWINECCWVWWRCCCLFSCWLCWFFISLTFF